eukprot:SAG11_NODE_2229_length_3658_cov_3.278730_3_plen_200_part_00
MFVNQREELFRRIMQFYNCSRKAAKQLVIKHLHGGKVRQWLVDWKIADDICARIAQSGHCRIVMDLETESADIAAFFLDSFPEFKTLLDTIQAQERANSVQPRNMSGPMTALAHGLATFEDRLLKHLHVQLQIVEAVDVTECSTLQRFHQVPMLGSRQFEVRLLCHAVLLLTPRTKLSVASPACSPSAALRQLRCLAER